MVLFFDVTRRLLEERLSLVREGIAPAFTDIRHFFYECRNVFLKEHPNLKEIDSKSNSLYGDFGAGVIGRFCIDHCEEFGIPRELYWRLREKLNIWAEAKAVCEGNGDKFMVDKDTRSRVGENCSFVLLCEKKTVSRELLEALRNRGYRIHLVSTGGQSPSDVHEALIEAIEDIDPDNPTFYVLVLHDFDISGVTIYYNLKDRIDEVIDVGVNRNFFQQLPNIEWRLVEEQRLNRKDNQKLKKRITQDSDNLYSLEDYEYMQGKLSIVLSKKGREKNQWEGKRVEIDAIHVQYGIKPFVDYIEQRISEECKCFDLERIGVEEFELEEPSNPFEVKLRQFREGLSRTYYNKKRELERPLDRIQNIFKQVSEEALSHFDNVCGEHGVEWNPSGYYSYDRFTLTRSKENELKEGFREGFDREYVPDFEDDLTELNNKIKCYCGDIKNAKDKIQGEFDKLQKDVYKAAEEDEEVQIFEQKLDGTDFGVEKLDTLELPDEKEVIREVVSRLQDRLADLESE